MILASSQVSAAAQWLRDLAATLSTQEVAVGTIDAAVAAAIDDLHDHWGGPIPRTVSGCLRSYHAVVGATPEAMFAARVLLMLWAGFADTLAAELAQAESTIARVESVRGTEAEAPGDHDDELSAISRRNSCSEQWTSACVRFSAGLEPTVNALAGAAECWAVEASMVYPSGAAYTRTLCELAVSSGVRIEELDPNGEWDESSADILRAARARR